MPWHYVADFFGGLFLANGGVHLLAGGRRRRFPTPFANPPFRGLSSPFVNILWGLFNFFMSYALLKAVGEFPLQHDADALVAGIGFVLAALFIARSIVKRRKAEAETE